MVRQPRSRRPDGEDTRARLLRAGEDLAAEMAFAHVTVHHVTTRAGTGRATFYLYFENINQFFIELARESCEQLITNMSQPWAYDDVRVSVERCLSGYVDTFRRHAGVMGVCYSRRFLDEGFTELLVGTRKQIIDRVAKNIQEGMAEGAFRAVDAQLVSDALVCMVEALCVHELDDGRKGALEHVVGTMADIWIGAFAVGADRP